MQYEQDNLVLDFARRTKSNLDFIEEIAKEGSEDVYEVTQLINSLLGLLVFPQQEFYADIPQTSLEELIKHGWPNIELIEGKLPQENLQQLMRYLRNGVSHHNIEFTTSDEETISGVIIWNVPERSNKTDWKVKLPLSDIKILVSRFIELLEEIMKTSKG